jgi:hypothetical protein
LTAGSSEAAGVEAGALVVVESVSALTASSAEVEAEAEAEAGVEGVVLSLTASFSVFAWTPSSPSS